MCRTIDMTSSPSKGIYSVVIGRTLSTIIGMTNIFFPRAGLIEVLSIIEYLFSNAVENRYVRII